MNNTYTVVFTQHVKAAAAAVSLGAKLFDFDKDGEDPVIRQSINVNGKQTVQTTWNFHEKTNVGSKVSDIFKAFKILDTEKDTSSVPKDHIIHDLHKVGNLRDEIHRKFMGCFSKISQPSGSVASSNTKLVTVLNYLGVRILGFSREHPKMVVFYLEDSPLYQELSIAWAMAWAVYTLDEDHKLYHLRGYLENREELIKLSNKSQIMGSVQDGGRTYRLPINASDLQLSKTINKLGLK